MKQADFLREDIARLTAEHGPDDPFVQALKRQLSELEARNGQPRDTRQIFWVGARGPAQKKE